jgi:hypothetical protein
LPETNLQVGNIDWKTPLRPWMAPRKAVRDRLGLLRHPAVTWSLRRLSSACRTSPSAAVRRHG